VASNHRGVLAQHGRDLVSRESPAVERAEVGELAWLADQAIAEIVFAAGVKLHIRG
jgi:hypothetical protein